MSGGSAWGRDEIAFFQNKARQWFGGKGKEMNRMDGFEGGLKNHE